MQFLPFYVTKKKKQKNKKIYIYIYIYIYPIPKLVIKQVKLYVPAPGLSVAPGVLSDLQRVFCSGR